MSLLDGSLNQFGYCSGVQHVLKIVSTLINYSYYYSYTADQCGLLNRLMQLQSSPFYNDVQMLIAKMNEQLLAQALEPRQRLFMPVQRGYITTQYSIISSAVAVLHSVTQTKKFTHVEINLMDVETHDGCPWNALEAPVNLNKESICVFTGSSDALIYRPYFTKSTVEVLV